MSRSLRLARTMRCAIVASGTRNARASSGVSRPPSRRSVSATWASGASAGWQQRNISRSWSSGTTSTRASRSSELRSVVGFHVTGLVESVGGEVALGAGRLAPQPVDRPVAGGGRDPAARVRRHARLRPALGRDRERLGHRVLGEVDVAEDTDQRRGAAAGLAPEDGGQVLAHRVVQPWIGRTSMGRSHAAAALPAHSRAASRSGTSITQKPPICSFDSA